MPATPAVRDHSKDLNWVGKSIRRIEDPKFLRGRGNYIDDYETPNMLEVAIVRSTEAHARIVSIDTSAAEALPGVVAVVTGAEAIKITDPMPDFGPSPDKHTWYCLATEKVRYMGEGVAAVAAETRAIAEDAAELVGRNLRAAGDDHRSAPRYGRGRSPGTRSPGVKHPLPSEVHFRQCGRRLRRRGSGGERRPPLGALRGATAGNRRRSRRLRPRDGDDDHPRQLPDSYEFPVHAGRHAESA